MVSLTAVSARSGIWTLTSANYIDLCYNNIVNRYILYKSKINNISLTTMLN